MVADRMFLGTDSSFGENDGWSVLACPRCGDADGLHLDDAVIGGAGGVIVEVTTKGEDVGTIPEVTVTQSSGASARAKRAEASMRNHRRHFIELIGWCEICGRRFAIVFHQHRGATYVALTDEPSSADAGA